MVKIRENTGIQRNSKKIISTEIAETSKPFLSSGFFFLGSFCLVVGNEFARIPALIIKKITAVYMHVPGVGRYLSTAKTANIFLYEISKQIIKNKKILVA